VSRREPTRPVTAQVPMVRGVNRWDQSAQLQAGRRARRHRRDAFFTNPTCRAQRRLQLLLVVERLFRRDKVTCAGDAVTPLDDNAHATISLLTGDSHVLPRPFERPCTGGHDDRIGEAVWSK